MDQTDRQEKQSCAIDCRRCPVGRLDDERTEVLRGWRLVGPCLIAFLLPLALAIMGAYVGGPGRNRQFLGAIVGPLVGAAAAWMIGTLARRADKERV